MATTVLSSAVMEMVADVATIAVSGLSFYYSSAAAMVPVLAVTAVDVITLDAAANFPTYTQKGVHFALLFVFYLNDSFI